VSNESDIKNRKSDHIRICLDESSQFDSVTCGFENFRFRHCALPELAPEDVDLTTKFLEKTLQAPIIVSSMTGGPVDGARINENLAKGVSTAGLGMGVGSQRIAFVDPDTAPSFEVRKFAPNIPLLGNMGAVQLNYGFSIDEVKKAVEMLKADGVFLHLNALQELVQPNGDTNFRGLMGKIAALIKEVEFPVLIKECGCGISGELAKRLYEIGVFGIDISGAGGTSWSKVEAHRSEPGIQKSLGQTFANWGIPTAECIIEVRQQNPNGLLIASGGIRNGIDAAKALALGADIVSIAQPILPAALKNAEAVAKALTLFIEELRAVCFLTSCKTPKELNGSDLMRRMT
jgi:isopentenyl-diphosphate Delta-isomerase